MVSGSDGPGEEFLAGSRDQTACSSSWVELARGAAQEPDPRVPARAWAQAWEKFHSWCGRSSLGYLAVQQGCQSYEDCHHFPPRFVNLHEDVRQQRHCAVTLVFFRQTCLTSSLHCSYRLSLW